MSCSWLCFSFHFRHCSHWLCMALAYTISELSLILRSRTAKISNGVLFFFVKNQPVWSVISIKRHQNISNVIISSSTSFHVLLCQFRCCNRLMIKLYINPHEYEFQIKALLNNFIKSDVFGSFLFIFSGLRIDVDLIMSLAHLHMQTDISNQSTNDICDYHTFNLRNVAILNTIRTDDDL